jgi:hypothetical protein
LTLGATVTTVAGLTSVTSTTFVGALTGAATSAGTVTTAAQPSITSVGTLTSLTVSGAISTAGNITGSYIIGNGSQLTGLPASGLKWSTVANAAPSTPSPGDFWYNSYTGIKYQYTNDGTGNVWVDQSYPTTFSTLAVTGNITAGNLSVSTGIVTLGSIVNANGNGVGNIGSSTGYFNTVFAKATSSQYADLAELYTADQDYPPGTVVEFGGKFDISISTQTHSTRTAGVISTNPSYTMNSALTGDHVLPVALTGRVPCRVIGKIHKGDRLVSSAVAGIAMALDNRLYEPGCIIGKALEDYDSIEDGIIEIAVGRY